MLRLVLAFPLFVLDGQHTSRFVSEDVRESSDGGGEIERDPVLADPQDETAGLRIFRDLPVAGFSDRNYFRFI
jgi:hypothetical protein